MASGACIEQCYSVSRREHRSDETKRGPLAGRSQIAVRDAIVVVCGWGKNRSVLKIKAHGEDRPFRDPSRQGLDGPEAPDALETDMGVENKPMFNLTARGAHVLYQDEIPTSFVCRSYATRHGQIMGHPAS